MASVTIDLETRQTVYLDDEGVETDRVDIPPARWAELFPDPALVESRNAVILTAHATATAARAALTDAVDLAALSPHPTPEDQAIVNAQIAAALATFRMVSNPPADLVALAASVLSFEVVA